MNKQNALSPEQKLDRINEILNRSSTWNPYMSEIARTINPHWGKIQKVKSVE